MEGVRCMASASSIVRGEELTAERLWAVAQRSATNAYLDVARRLGLLRGRQGHDLLRRLGASDPHTHRGAMAECVSAWWLHSPLGLPLVPRPPGVGRKVLEFAIEGDPRIGVEVKAPYRPMRYVPSQVYTTDPMATDHVGAVVTCLGDAAQKLDPAQLNMVILVPSLDWPVLPAVIRALEEEDKLPIDIVMIIDTMHDAVNPIGGVPGQAFLMHRCSLVRNRRRHPPRDSLWGGWPVYERPNFEYWTEISPVSGSRTKDWVRTPSVSFEGWMLVLA